VEAGIVGNQAQAIFAATAQRTALIRLIEPTPAIAPVMTCVVETPTPTQVDNRMELGAAVSAQYIDTSLSESPWPGFGALGQPSVAEIVNALVFLKLGAGGKRPDRLCCTNLRPVYDRDAQRKGIAFRIGDFQPPSESKWASAAASLPRSPAPAKIRAPVPTRTAASLGTLPLGVELRQRRARRSAVSVKAVRQRPLRRRRSHQVTLSEQAAGTAPHRPPASPAPTGTPSAPGKPRQPLPPPGCR